MLADAPDLAVVWVMAKAQYNSRSDRFVDEYNLRGRVHFWRDPDSRAIDALGLRRPNPEPIEAGVPHPTTLLLDRRGIVRFIDVREDYQMWLAAAVIREHLAQLES
jgi:peroxiredoxin